jgi:H+/Cl- antiporter ClcA
VLIAAGAGAGLATAFNAPIAGAIFVLEELIQKFEHRIAIAALAASATAIAVARILLPDAPDFVVAPLSYGTPEARPLFFALGGVIGLLAIAYNNALLGTIAAAERLRRLPVEARAGLIGAAVGTLGWFAPTLIGGGDATQVHYEKALHQMLDENEALRAEVDKLRAEVSRLLAWINGDADALTALQAIYLDPNETSVNRVKAAASAIGFDGPS